jgi:hypothetical protein
MSINSKSMYEMSSTEIVEAREYHKRKVEEMGVRTAAFRKIKYYGPGLTEGQERANSRAKSCMYSHSFRAGRCEGRLITILQH